MIPPLVERAGRLAGEHDCGPGYPDENGLLLHVLAGRRAVARAGAIGTGCGVAAAWIVSALVPGTPFVAVETVQAQAELARELFAADRDVSVLAGDWRHLLPAEAPFDFLFVAATAADGDPPAVVDLLAPGGTVVAACDDGTREPWLRQPALPATAVETGAGSVFVLGVRIR